VLGLNSNEVHVHIFRNTNLSVLCVKLIPNLARFSDSRSTFPTVSPLSYNRILWAITTWACLK